MNLINIFVVIFIGILTIPNSEAWEEDEFESGYDTGPEDSIGSPSKQKLRTQDIPDDGWYHQSIFPPPNKLPSSFIITRKIHYPEEDTNRELETIDRLRKRYMGMEIPEYITKAEGGLPGAAGSLLGSPPKGEMKHKLLHSG